MSCLITLLPLSSFFNSLLKALSNGECSYLTCSTTPYLDPKSSPVIYSYFSNYLDNNVQILAASLWRSY